MPLGKILAKKKFLDEEQLEMALERQKVAGGLLGDNLVALGFVTREDLAALFQEPPPAPYSIDATGLKSQFLSNLLLRIFQVLGPETNPEIADRMKLPQDIVESLLSHLQKQGLIEVLPTAASGISSPRYALTSGGRAKAMDAFKESEYIGPAPVPLTDYEDQVQRQSITYERINAETLCQGFTHLILPRQILRRLGPAINSGRAMLIYGPSGNGKTSISEAIGRIFHQAVYIPYSIVVEEQIIKIFDPALHKEMPFSTDSTDGAISLPQAKVDERWVRCRRPCIRAGNELTLKMLDLDFDPVSKSYEAPLQVKATGGVFVMDDFGRQMARPRELLNRLIIPLEKKLDYLTFQTGKKFHLSFDELLILCTNLPPRELMDPALLRRVQYKLRVDTPSAEDYRAIFRKVCDVHKLYLPEDILNYLLNDFYPKRIVTMAAHHPEFIVEHAIASCKYENIRPRLTLDLVNEALENLIISESATA